LASDNVKRFKFFHVIFEVGIILKGINASIELALGTSLIILSADKLRGFITNLITPLLDHKRWSWLSDAATRYAERITISGKDFAGWYFLTHGVVKLLVVICLLKRWFWAYPVAIAMFIMFVLFQTGEFLLGSHSWFYLFLDIFDGLMIWLTVNEWKHAKSLAAKAS
jgi:uncharacterized membrane protein